MSEEIDSMIKDVQDANNRLSNVVWGVAGTLLLGIGSWTVTTLTTLTEKIDDISISVVKLEGKVNNMPPADLLLRINTLESGHQKMMDKLERLNRRINAKLGIDTGAILEGVESERTGG